MGIFYIRSEVGTLSMYRACLLIARPALAQLIIMLCDIYVSNGRIRWTVRMDGDIGRNSEDA